MSDKIIRKMKVYLNDSMDESAIARLKKHVDIVDNYEHPEELDAIIVRQSYCPGDVIRKAVRCRLIQQHGTGLDRIDVEAAGECGIPVQNTPGFNSRSVAEYALLLMMECARKSVHMDHAVRKGLIKKFGQPETIGNEISGAKLGLVGCGHVAEELSRIAKGGFGMEVFCYNPNRSDEYIREQGYIPVPDLGSLFACCNYISVHAPINENTYHMIDSEVLSHAKEGLVLVSTARGGIIDEEDLCEALKNGRIKAAGLDVFEKEPPAVDNPLFALGNFVGSMHVAGSTREALYRTGKAVVDEVFKALGIVE